jgi:transposase-like protein
MSAAQSRAADRPRAAASNPAADQPALAVAEVARRLGVAPATLRTWDRRYGLGPTAHPAGSHRRYTIDDIARLMVMRSLTLGGVAPADAARAALATRSWFAADASFAAILSSPAPSRPATHTVPPVPSAGRPETTSPTLLVDAALRDDAPACRRLLAAMPGDVASWWTELVEPARASLAARTVFARAGEDPEWVLDSAALGALRRRAAPARGSSPGEPLVLLLTAPHERRPLALHALATALSDHGLDARLVTGPVEPHRVLELVAMAHPVAVALLSELTAPDLAVVAHLHAADPELPLVVGLGEEHAGPPLPQGPSVRQVHDFAGLVREVLAVTR